MSIASRIQEIETHIGDVYDTINYSYDTTGVNKNIINIPKYLKKGYIDIINNGTDTLYNNFPKVSGIGSNLSLTPTYEAPMKLNEIQGDTLQDSQPTPSSPVPIQSVTGLQNINVCGKNLLNSSQESYTLPANENYSQAIGEIYLKANTKYYFSYNVDNDSASNTRSTPYLQIGGGNRIYQNAVSNNNLTKGRKVWEYTPTESAIYNVGYWLHTSNVAVSISNFMISTSTATTYEPYKGNTYKVNLGKNLFDINGTFTGNLIKYNNGFQLIKNSTNRTINYLPSSPIPKGTYTLSYEIVSSTLSDVNKLLIQFFNVNNTNILTKTLSSTGSLNCILTEDVTKIYFYISNSEETDTQITFDNIQLEKGTQSTSFSPYFTPIELNKISTYKDRIYKDNGKWYLEKQIGKVVLDGTENGWSYNDANAVFIIPDLVDYLRDGFIPYSNLLQGQNISAYNQLSANSISFLRSTTQNRIVIKNTNYTGVTAFKNWLNSNNVTVYYVLATPTYTEITNTELIKDLETLYTAKSQEGTTNISITSEDLEMILNVSALKGEV